MAKPRPCDALDNIPDPAPESVVLGALGFGDTPKHHSYKMSGYERAIELLHKQLTNTKIEVSEFEAIIWDESEIQMQYGYVMGSFYNATNVMVYEINTGGVSSILDAYGPNNPDIYLTQLEFSSHRMYIYDSPENLVLFHFTLQEGMLKKNGCLYLRMGPRRSRTFEPKVKVTQKLEEPKLKEARKLDEPKAQQYGLLIAVVVFILIIGFGLFNQN